MFSLTAKFLRNSHIQARSVKELPKLSKKLGLKGSGASQNQRKVSRENNAQSIWD